MRFTCKQDQGLHYQVSNVQAEQSSAMPQTLAFVLTLQTFSSYRNWMTGLMVQKNKIK